MNDPYAAIRRLPFLRFDYPTSVVLHHSEAGTTSTTVPAQIQYELRADFLSAEQRPFQSKYNTAQTNPDGTISVTLQQPAEHKYDTMIGVYQPVGGAERVDTRYDEIGQSVPVYAVTGLLVNDPATMPTRQESTAHGR